MEKKIVIIGGGIAGLSAGCYGRMNGYETEVYEAHNLPGGLCTTWKRGEYKIDGCISWLTGSAPADNFYKLWKELGAIQNREIHNHEEFYRVTDSDGKTFIAYTDADRLEKHMKELSPGDAETIELLCRLIRKFAKFNSPLDKAFELLNLMDIIKMMWSMRTFMKDMNFCNGITVDEFSKRFKDPFLREAFPKMIDAREMSLLVIVITLALLHNKAGGFPIGGSLEFARAIEKRMLDLGGKIFYKKKVEKILDKEGKAAGILLSDGTQIMADYVISCADLHNTVYKMLDGKFIQPQHEELFRSAKLYHSSVQVSFGVNMDLSKEPDCVGQVIKLQDTVIVGGQKKEWFTLKNFCFDSTLAPKGKSVVECTIWTDDFEYWEKLYANPEAYKAEKERILKEFSEILEKKYPGFISSIEVTDVASPMTYVRYTANYRGKYMTWNMTPDLIKRHRLIKKTLPGLDNFWLSGMWVMAPGGLPTGAKCSRDVLQMICRKDKKKFTTTEL